MDDNKAAQEKIDQHDWALLSLANDDKGKFAIQLGYPMVPQMQETFERAIDNDWFRLVDIAMIEAAGNHGYMRVFKLTQEGWARLHVLAETYKRELH